MDSALFESLTTKVPEHSTLQDAYINAIILNMTNQENGQHTPTVWDLPQTREELDEERKREQQGGRYDVDPEDIPELRRLGGAEATEAENQVRPVGQDSNSEPFDIAAPAEGHEEAYKRGIAAARQALEEARRRRRDDE